MTGHPRPSGICPSCGTWTRSLELDHINPHGMHDTSNLQWLCPQCHSSKTAQENSVARKGLRRSDWAKKSPQNRLVNPSGVCTVCKTHYASLELDHILPRFELSSDAVWNTLENIRWICASCHQLKSNEEVGRRTRGKSLPPETREKISRSLKGRPKSDETKRKMREAMNRPEHKENLQQKFLGNTHRRDFLEKQRDSSDESQLPPKPV